MKAHDPLPKRGTLRSETTGKPASRHNLAAYPLLAECAVCGQEIRVVTYLGKGFEHVEPTPNEGVELIGRKQ